MILTLIRHCERSAAVSSGIYTVINNTLPTIKRLLRRFASRNDLSGKNRHCERSAAVSSGICTVYNTLSALKRLLRRFASRNDLSVKTRHCERSAAVSSGIYTVIYNTLPAIKRLLRRFASRNDLSGKTRHSERAVRRSAAISRPVQSICWAASSKLAGLFLCLLAASTLQAEPVKELHRPSLPKAPESRPPIQLNMPSLEQMTAEPMVMVEDINDPLAPLLSLMKQGKWRPARKLVSLMLSDEPNSLHLLFLSGQINERLEEYQDAIDAYRKMLEIDAQLARPRYELARMLFADGAMGAAEYQFRLTLSLDLPFQAQKEVRQYLKHIAQQRTSWGISVAMIPSSNINNGTSEKSYTKDGVEYVYSEDTQAQSGIGANLSLWGEHRFGSKLQWFVKGLINHNDYKGHELDNSYLKLTAGRSFSFKNTRVQLGLGGHIAGYQYEELYKGEVADLSLSHQFSNSTLYFGGAGFQKLRYQPERDFLNASQVSSYLGVSHTVAGRTTHTLSLQLAGNKAEQETDEYRRAGLNYAIRLPIQFQALTFDASIGVAHKRYLAEDGYFQTTREDIINSLDFGVLKRNWNWLGFAPKLDLSYEYQDSNISLHRKQTLQAMIKITNEF